MRNSLKIILVAAALAWPSSALLARQPQPPPAPQPANNDDDAADAQIDAGEQDARGKLEVELRELAQRQRELAAARFQVAQGEAVGGMAQVRLARAKTEKAAWLGVQTSKVPQALRHQLKLKNKYTGLIIERVEPESPADQAGLEQYDIIEKVGDQWIVNTEQFSVVLRMNEPGQEVTLSIIRQGQPQEVKAKLAEKELPVLGMNQLDFINVPGQAAVAAGGVFQMGPNGALFFRDGQFEPLMNFEGKLRDHSTMTVKDDEHTLKVTTKKGLRQLEASDANGVVFFEGPINTEEEMAQVPDEIRGKVEKLDDMPAWKARGVTATTKNAHNEKE